MEFERRLASKAEVVFIVLVPLAAFVLVFLCCLWYLFYAADPVLLHGDPTKHGLQSKDTLALRVIRRVRTDNSDKTDSSDETAVHEAQGQDEKTNNSKKTRKSKAKSKQQREKYCCSKSRRSRLKSCKVCGTKLIKTRTCSTVQEIDPASSSSRKTSMTITSFITQDWWRRDFDEEAFETAGPMSFQTARPGNASFEIEDEFDVGTMGSVYTSGADTMNITLNDTSVYTSPRKIPRSMRKDVPFDEEGTKISSIAYSSAASRADTSHYDASCEMSSYPDDELTI